MSWIKLKGAEDEKPAQAPTQVAEEPSAIGERHVPIEDLDQGKIFSINPQAQKFEFRGFDNTPTTQYPKGRILTKTVNPDGSSGAETSLDYGTHQGMKVVIWNSLFATQDVTHPYNLFERIQLKGENLQGVVLDLNKSKFPDCDIIVMWDQPLHGEPITEVHGHEIVSLGEQVDEQARIYGGADRPICLAEIRQMVLDLRGNHDQKFEDKTKVLIQENIQKALQSKNEFQAQLNEEQKKAVADLCSKAIAEFASELKTITNSCVMSVTAGTHNYELDQVSLMLANYTDDIYRRVASLTDDLVLVVPATSEVLNIIADSVIKSYFLNGYRQGFVRKAKDGRWQSVAENQKIIGAYPTKAKAVKHLRLIEVNKS